MDVNSQFNWGLWLKWLVATAIAFLVPGVLQVFSDESIPVYYFEGFIIALFQWFFVLRSRYKDAHLWIWISGVGWVVGTLFGTITSITIVYLAIHGLIFGTFQWVFFLRKLFSKAYLWILINTILWPFTVALTFLVDFSSGNNEGPLLEILLLAALQGIIFGAITGIALFWLSFHSHDEVKPSASIENQEFKSTLGLPRFRYISATIISTIITITAAVLLGNNCSLSKYSENLFFIFIAAWLSWAGMLSLFQGKRTSPNVLGILLSLVFISVAAFFCIAITAFWIAPVCD